MATKEEIMLERFLTRMEREPDDVQHSVVRYAENIMNGCNWAFISEKSPTYALETKAFEKSKLVKVYKIHGGVLITTPLETIFSILSRVSPELYDAKAKNAALAFRTKSTEAFVNLLKSGVKQAKVGIYNLNDSPNITINGHIYKAFNIDLAYAAMFLRDAGYSIVIRGRKVPASYALIEENLPNLLEQLQLAPSGNGLMLEFFKG